MTTNEFIEYNKIIAICRRMDVEDILRLAEALLKGGVRLIEVTFDQSNEACLTETSEAVSRLVGEFGSDMRIGAGTVLTGEQVIAARDAGAEYIISPNTSLEIIHLTKECGLSSIPGASTPSEIVLADENGADFVKLFPAGYYGPGYFKDIKAPLSHIKLIATAGITDKNLAQFLELGSVGAGISSYLTGPELVARGDFREITRRAAGLMEIVSQYRRKQ